MVTTTSACSASALVRSRGRRSDRSMSSSRIAAMTSGWTFSAGLVPAEDAVWRPAAARSNRAWLICERPALCRQTNSARAIAPRLLDRLGGEAWRATAHELVAEDPDRRADERPEQVDPQLAPSARRQRRA